MGTAHCTMVMVPSGSVLYDRSPIYRDVHMMLCIIESASGDTFGYVNIVGMDDERILEWLCSTGSYLSGGPYLMGSPDDYEITRCYPFAEGELVVIDIETG